MQHPSYIQMSPEGISSRQMHNIPPEHTLKIVHFKSCTEDVNKSLQTRATFWFEACILMLGPLRNEIAKDKEILQVILYREKLQNEEFRKDKYQQQVLDIQSKTCPSFHFKLRSKLVHKEKYSEFASHYEINLPQSL